MRGGERPLVPRVIRHPLFAICLSLFVFRCNRLRLRLGRAGPHLVEAVRQCRGHVLEDEDAVRCRLDGRGDRPRIAKLVRHKERVPRAGYGVVDRDGERRGAGAVIAVMTGASGSGSGSGPGADVQ